MGYMAANIVLVLGSLRQHAQSHARRQVFYSTLELRALAAVSLRKLSLRAANLTTGRALPRSEITTLWLHLRADIRMPIPVALLTSRMASCLVASFFCPGFFAWAAWNRSSTCRPGLYNTFH